MVGYLRQIDERVEDTEEPVHASFFAVFFLQHCFTFARKAFAVFFSQVRHVNGRTCPSRALREAVTYSSRNDYAPTCTKTAKDFKGKQSGGKLIQQKNTRIKRHVMFD